VGARQKPHQASGAAAALLPTLHAQCVAMSTAQKVSELPASLQKIVGAFQMVRWWVSAVSQTPATNPIYGGHMAVTVACMHA